MNTAEYLVKRLKELGISDFFGFSGDYNSGILNAVKNTPQTNVISCTSSFSAGCAADGYARECGYSAVVTGYGAGELSVLNEIAACVSENIPVIFIACAPAFVNNDVKKIRLNVFEGILPAAFLKYDNAKSEIDRVLEIFIKEKRPVYISIPDDIAKSEISEYHAGYNQESNYEVLEKASKEIADKIAGAQRPVILADALIKRFNAVAELREFSEKSGIPSVTTLTGTGLLNYNSENYAGTYFSEFQNPTAKKLLEETDCLIAAAETPSGLNPFCSENPYKLAHISIYGTYTCIEDKKYENIKMNDVLKKLSDIIEKRSFSIEKTPAGYDKAPKPEGNITPAYFYPRIQEFFQDNDIIFAETKDIIQNMAAIKYPQNADFNAQISYSCAGWATSAVLGACMAKLNSRVILITNASSHQITAMELGNMMKYGIKPVILVLNNSGCIFERINSGYYESGVNNTAEINYSKFARIFGGDIWSARVTTAQDFDTALKVTQIVNKICYIEICMEQPYIQNLKKNFYEKQLITAEAAKAPAKTVALSAETGVIHAKIPEQSSETADTFKKSENIPAEISCYNKKEEAPPLIGSGDMNFETIVHESFHEEEKMCSTGKLFVISGSSGVGKGTVIKTFLELHPELKLSISYTTRPKREGEIDGINYFFLNKADFTDCIKNGEFLEWAEFSGNMYGTKKTYVEKCLSRGDNLILEIDTKGAVNVKSILPQAVLIFILPPSFEELEARLRGRHTETEEAIQRRLEAAKFELKNSEKFDYRVVNDSIENTVKALEEIIL